MLKVVVCRMSIVCQINCVGGITYGPRACSKSFFGAVKKNVTLATTVSLLLIGERAKRARHSQVCSIENRGYIILL